MVRAQSTIACAIVCATNLFYRSNGQTGQGFAEIVKSGDNAKAYAGHLDVRALREEDAPTAPEVTTKSTPGFPYALHFFFFGCPTTQVVIERLF